MIITTWNVQNGTTKNRLAELQGSFDADIAIFQETSVSDKVSDVFWAGDRASKGISLWSRLAFSIVSSEKHGSAAIAAYFPSTPLGPLNVLGIWTQKQPDYELDIMNTLQAHSDFIKLRPTIILGDFNLDRRIVGKAKSFDRVNDYLEQTLGMRSAYHHHSGEEFGQERSATHYHLWKSTRPFHCDYIYMPSIMIQNIKRVTVPEFSDFESSDHRPVVCEF